MDLLREVFSDLEAGALSDMVDEMIPFSEEYMININSILNKEELG
jgi:hypothetical protein